MFESLGPVTVQDTVEINLTLKVFKDIHLSRPLLMNQGAPVDPLDLASLSSKFAEFEKSRRPNLDLIAGANLFWLNIIHEPMPGVPINRAGIKYLVDYFFQHPARVDGLQVPVTGLSNVSEQKMKSQSLVFVSPQVLDMSCCSPFDRSSCPFESVDQSSYVRINCFKRFQEPVHAFVLAIARDVEAGKDTSMLEEWKRMALSCTIKFSPMDEQQTYWAAAQARENIGANFESQYLSVVTLLRAYCTMTIFVFNFGALCC